MDASWLPREGLVQLLLWTAVAITVFLLGLALAGLILQLRRDRQHRFRIRCHQTWEHLLAERVFLGTRGSDAVFREMGHRKRILFRSFLMRALETLGGTEADTVRALYGDLGLGADLPQRLRSPKARDRALAAMEVEAFRLEAHLPDLLPLLDDPAPFVAYAAARSLAGSHQLRYAKVILEWVLGQEDYQSERLIRVLTGFGTDFPEWMGAYLKGMETAPRTWRLYTEVVASTRHVASLEAMVALLDHGDPEVQVGALKALGALGHPEVFGRVRPFARCPRWVLRAQAARILGILGGPEAVGDLLELMTDRVFEVRRNAAQALLDVGPAGQESLRWLREDPQADPFARDLANERLEWARRTA